MEHWSNSEHAETVLLKPYFNEVYVSIDQKKNENNQTLPVMFDYFDNV